MSDFVRGGQITFHSLRMVVQLMKPLSRWGLIIWLALTITLVAIKHHYDYSISYVKAKFYTGIRLGALPLSVGRSKSTASNIVSNPVVHRYYSKTVDIVKDKSRLSFVMVAIGYLAILIFFTVKGAKLKQSGFIRGSRLETSKALKQLIVKHNKKAKYRDSYTITGIPYPAYSEKRHTMVSGVSGSGKTLVIKDLLAQIIKRGDRAIVYDFTGTYVESFYREGKDIILNPFDNRLESWSLLEEAEHPAEFDTIATALIGEDINSHGQFWVEGARMIFAELCKNQFKAGDLSIKNLLRQLNTAGMTELNKDLQGTLAYHLTDPKNKETTMGLIATMSTYLNALQYIKEASGAEKNFSIRKWIADYEGDNILFLSSRANLNKSIYPLISAMMDIAINNLMNLKVGTEKKTWVIFDEVASLNFLPSLEPGLTLSRNFGGCFVIAIQTIAQLFQRYGRNITNTVSSNCSTKVLLKAGDPETAGWCSDFIGSQEIEVFKENKSYGAHEMRDGVNMNQTTNHKPLILPSEFINLADLTGYISIAGNFPTAMIKIDYKDYPANNQAFVGLSVADNAETAR
jgi:type IV conjugative transfer system coupling protein TraD